MLRKLYKISGDIFLWKIELRMPNRRIHSHLRGTQLEAQKVYLDLLAEKNRSKFGLSFEPSTKEVVLSKAIAEYEEHMRTLCLTPDHIRASCASLRVLKDVVGDLPVYQITRRHIMAWQEHRKAMIDKKREDSAGRPTKPRTANKCLAHIRTFFKWCVPDYCHSNPANDVSKIKEIEPPLRLLHWIDFCKFADAAWSRPCFGLLIEVLSETGARIDELLRAKVSEIDIDRRVWTKVVKPGKRLMIDAEPWTIEAAKRNKDNEYLCPREDGKAWTYSMVRKAFKKAARDANVKVFTPHYLRHARACWDLADGYSLWQVKTKLGHSTTAITERYLRAAEVLKRAEKTHEKHRRPVQDHVTVCGKLGKFKHISTHSPINCAKEDISASSIYEISYNLNSASKTTSGP